MRRPSNSGSTSIIKASRLGWLALILAVNASAQVSVDGPAPNKMAPVQQASRTQFQQHVVQLLHTVNACEASAKACNAEIAFDDKVEADAQSPAFLERWDWLREPLSTGAKARNEDRVEAMQRAADHLRELEAEANETVPSTSAGEKARAQQKVGEVLSRSEFQRAAAGQPSWLDRQMARFWMWITELYEGVSRLGSAAPWLGRLVEWTFFVLAAAGLVLFIRRNFVRQQLQISMNSGAVQFSAWDREANDWAAEADKWAAEQRWRDAVHCLYWAAIVRLEARRAWRHNPARTPREYVRLLQAGSPQQGALRRLTAIFERVWYGLRDAEATDYASAKSLFGKLSDSSANITGGAAGDA